MATWTPQNLTKHYQKRVKKDAGCFEDLLGIHGRTMRESEYELRSHDAVARAWLRYEAESREIGEPAYRQAALYFVDPVLVVAITDPFERTFITCYHEHFGQGRHWPLSSMPTFGQRRLRYEKHLQFKQDGKLLVNVRIRSG